MSKLRLDIITIFPEYLEPLRHALLGKAIEQGILTVGIHNLRDWATGRHKSVDAPPLGGGPGMVMKPEVWGPALDAVAAGREGFEIDSAAAHRNDKARHDDVAGISPRPYAVEDDDRSLPLLLVPTPAGTPFTQADAQAFSREEHIVIACGRYEGIDQRVFEDARKRYRVREVSIGDYVLIGGEVAALVIAEAVTRLIPGVLGNTESHEEDSFSDGLLEGPAYTKPRQWRGIDAPEVLLSGDHAKVRRWRRDQALLRTRRVRPELLERAELDAADTFTLHAREVELVIDADVEDVPGAQRAVRKALRKSGIEVDSVDSALAGVIVRGRTALDEADLQQVVDKARRVLSKAAAIHSHE
ncbi:tRNA (guanosine(37)-N1)-methyltransferase TrmD [Corynebacterium sanguinis]|uniref:tRNA (guanosine(37)-N1)-methyltransferase TrmD n=1 Tax=Corynebacterium sanguinis TaxID=2594913 RepID=UPI0021AF4240|nr:tRNA (guanosine(37)-N1)-methyltransferase TrmD [Corynebacterium sanguinis]MCT1555476.1 tRNA (guanosine(37)-N1)-methyltransferase TrmD [Corynebacterium sanguinis]MCT1663142.1 tRNA (guanosine(37)-N1)-methyltransferase TrmD [Corynebacterium sanguinis]